MNAGARWLIGLVLLFSLASPQAAQADGWSLGDLNPFASKEETPRSKPSKRTPLIDGKLLQPPAAVSRLNSGTKRFFSKTWDVITFQDAKSDAKIVSRYPDWSQGSQRSNRTQSQQKKESWWSSLFKPSEPEPPQTLDDFFKLERPMP